MAVIGSPCGEVTVGCPALQALRTFVIWPEVLVTNIIFAFSGSQLASPGITSADDKFGHFGVYGLLGTLVCRLGRGGRTAILSLLVVAAYGASDEWHQSFVPGRSSDVMDWIADSTGALLA